MASAGTGDRRYGDGDSGKEVTFEETNSPGGKIPNQTAGEDRRSGDGDSGKGETLEETNAPGGKSLNQTAGEEQQRPEEPVVEPVVERRGRGRPKGTKTGASERALSNRDTLVKFRCAVDMAMTFFHEKVHKRLTRDHIELLAGTPFLHLFCFPKDFHLSSAVLHKILASYNEEEGVFTYGSKKLKFCPEEVAIVMGLPFDGERVEYYDRCTLTDSSMRLKYFHWGTPVGRAELQDKIIQSLDEGAPAKDVVALLVMYIFTMILFPQCGDNVPVNMFYYVDDIDSLNGYSWGKAVFEHLSKHIPLAAKWCKQMDQRVLSGVNSSGNVASGSVSDEASGSKRKREKTNDYGERYLSGCAVALMAWWYEHIDCSEFRKFTGTIPRFHNWKFDVTYTRKSLQKILEKHPYHMVSDQPLKRRSPEKLVYMNGFIANKYEENIRAAMGIQHTNMEALLIQFAPVFNKFGYDVSRLIKHQVRAERFLQIDYSRLVSEDKKGKKTMEKKKSLKRCKTSGGANVNNEDDDSHRSKRKSPRTKNATLGSASSSPPKTRQKMVARKNATPSKSEQPTTEGAGSSSQTKKKEKMASRKAPTRSKSKQTSSEGDLGSKQEKGGKKNKGAKENKFDFLKKIPYMSVDMEDSDYRMGAGIPHTGEGVTNKVYVEDLSYDDWYHIMVSLSSPLQTIQFLGKPDNWRPDLGMFSDVDDAIGDKQVVIKDRRYPGRELVSDVVSNLLDHWVCLLWSGNFEKPTQIVYTIPGFTELSRIEFGVQDMVEIIYGREISIEVVTALFRYMQRFTPVDAPWFFIDAYLGGLIHSYSTEIVMKCQPYLFTEPFDNASWAFMPLLTDEHWVLLAADIRNEKILMFHSGPSSWNRSYQKKHWTSIAWIKHFLAFRMKNPNWKNVDVKWQTNIPKQRGSLDCALYVLRYAYCLLNGIPMNFTQNDVMKDRLVLANKLLADELNEEKMTIEMIYPDSGSK